ncbi:type II toxin-antitoxin system RelE/ParE family toxin [Desmonostoc muscorum LEGE 12446]|uniref:Type II toxin-antitoxin system RelE/ParE family toxin n=1 Tax=Desmonostoc muscorum LEGE 12446 TaxID=1828758 RepID=A0A8J7AGE3_DESMC|nr:type II toxin-antitoxin system RelE/ParE family toxin [Desmonostoc muscorum]MCF2148108.1 type II toxin-antitoxin system RelE/ParE family toxin [Desmonostoc muscorum LEGE 12446]
MNEEWQIIFYRDSDGTEPVQEFLLDPSLTSGELKQFQVRVTLLTQKGLSLLLEWSDILDKIEGEKNLYELRLDNTPNNPRIFLCALVGKRLVLLHAFKKKGRKTPKLEIKIAAKRRNMVMANEEDEE